jgi:DNA ligase-1
MNSDQVFDAIEAIACNPSKTAKEAMVKALLEDELGRRVLCAAYDPTITYGIAKRPVKGGMGSVLLRGGCFDNLDALARRELTGGAAILWVTDALIAATAKSAELLWRIISKDLRAGFTDGTINRARPGTLPEFPYMRCSLPPKVKFETWPWAKGCFIQLKADGMFINANYDANTGDRRFYTRTGSMFPRHHPDLSAIASAIGAVMPSGVQLHGEFLVYRDGKVLPRQEGNGMLNSVQQGGRLDEGCHVEYHVWDKILLESIPDGIDDNPYWGRLKGLIESFQELRKIDPNAPLKLIETRVVYSLDAAYATAKRSIGWPEGLRGRHRQAPRACAGRTVRRRTR